MDHGGLVGCPQWLGMDTVKTSRVGWKHMEEVIDLFTVPDPNLQHGDGEVSTQV